MKITVDFNLEPISITDSSLLEEIIREKFKQYVHSLILHDADIYDVGNPQLWIDVSDDGVGKYNIYQIKLEE